ncbi:MAG: monofunctional biosynthetic peptidoglycan transglycosylase [Desulfamplus sp.]|nr:monofunctional biosynthetic peptidoglycan transglycosylase [Desulfamplus sp.]
MTTLRLIQLIKKYPLKTTIFAIFVFLFIPIAQIFIIKFINPFFTIPMVWEWCVKRVTQENYIEFSYQWRELDEISPNLRRAVLAAEDQRFLSHNGFDFIELKKAVDDIKSGKKTRGASTITMQAARSLFLVPWRSIIRKGIEAYYTVFMELFWGKKRILEIYLNTVDWGIATVGAEAASQRYFSCSAKELTKSQAAILAAILPSPHTWSPTQPDSYVRSRQKRIMRDMRLMPLL